MHLTPSFLVDYAKKFHEKDKESQTLVVIDEAQILFNCRDFRSYGRDKWLIFFPQHRKLGFDSQYTKTLDLVDEAIKKHKKLSKNIPDITMYLPKNPKPVKYEPTLLEKFKNSFKKK